jgi:hypothetical protein
MIGPVRAVFASDIDRGDPLRGLEIGDRPEPDVPDGWTTVAVKAASLNHHDLWSLRGVGLPEERLPMILGCDAAGLDPEGNDGGFRESALSELDCDNKCITDTRQLPRRIKVSKLIGRYLRVPRRFDAGCQSVGVLFRPNGGPFFRQSP